MITIVPSLASADQLNLERQLDRLKYIKNIHIDIEDGNFVNNITFGIKTVRAVAAFVSAELDVHLLVMNPEHWINELLPLGIRKIAVHIESAQYPTVFLNRIRSAGGRPGLALNCMTSIDCVLPYVDDLDYVLIMTAEPDGRMQRFNPHMLKKIADARRVLPSRISIMVDGGIKRADLRQVADAGADTIVLGREIWEAPAPAERYASLMKEINER